MAGATLQPLHAVQAQPSQLGEGFLRQSGREPMLLK
jgi:hypothetical protein